MAFFRTVGKGIGVIGGGLIGGSVKIAGRAVASKWSKTGEWIEDVGVGIQTASKVALDNAGQFVDGTIQGTYGLVTKDAHHKQQGFHDIKDSTRRTAKGIGSTISYTAKNIGHTYKGLRDGDKEQAIHGLKNVGKVAAVSGLAIGVIDIMDGVDTVEAQEISTLNAHLDDQYHPVTGVLFDNKQITLPTGETVEGTFPIFPAQFEVVLPEDMYLASDDIHNNYANQAIYETIVHNPQQIDEMGLTSSDIQLLAEGKTPEGYTWHHHEEPGVLQLVDSDLHNQTAHTGGRFIWAGGSEYR